MHKEPLLVAGLLSSEVTELFLMVPVIRNVLSFCWGDDADALTGHCCPECAATGAEVWCGVLWLECPSSQHMNWRMADFPFGFFMRVKWLGFLELRWGCSSGAAGIKPSQRGAFHSIVGGLISHCPGLLIVPSQCQVLLVSLKTILSLTKLTLTLFDQNTAMSWPSFSTRLHICRWTL